MSHGLKYGPFKYLPQASFWNAMKAVISLLFVLVCSIPAIRFCYLIQTIGANNLSNDYLALMPVIDQMLCGKFSSLRLIPDAFVADHFIPVTILVHFFCAKFLDWNARSELYLGMGLALARCFLLYFLFCGSDRHKPKYLFMGGILALIFSMSQASVFFYGESSIPIGLSLLGFLVGFFAIAKIETPWLRRGLIVFGGMLSSLSWGNLAPCWFSFLIACFLFKRSTMDYLVCLIGALASLIPYSFILTALPRSHYFSHFFSCETWGRFICILGASFCNDPVRTVNSVGMAIVAGLTGILLYFISLVSLIANKRFGVKEKASLILVIYVLCSAWLISSTRPAIAPWYNAISINLWIAVVALSDSLLDFVPRRIDQSVFRLALDKKFSLWLLGCVNLAIILLFYCQTNLSYEDKHFFLFFRTPVSESILRNYRRAPTYCENFIFTWGDGHPKYLRKLAEPLERHRISAFSNQQQWTLQGDFPLATVSLDQGDGPAHAFWTESINLQNATSWRSYKHLNLCLANKDRINWVVNLPNNTESAVFHTACAVPDSCVIKNASIQSVNFVINLNGKDQQTNQIKHAGLQRSVQEKGKWYPISFPLTEFKGRPLSITLSATAGGTMPIMAIYQYPHIDIRVTKASENANYACTGMPNYRHDQDFHPYISRIKESPADEAATQDAFNVLDQNILPDNTDLSPYLVKRTAADYIFPMTNDMFWREEKVLSPDQEIIKNSFGYTYDHISYPALVSANRLAINLKDYSHLAVNMKCAFPFNTRRFLLVTFNCQDNFPMSFSIPLLSDNKLHTYTYDFKMLDLNKAAMLNQITISPVERADKISSATVKVESMQLIHK